MRPNKNINSGAGKGGFTKGRWTAPPVVDDDTDDEDIEVIVDDTDDAVEAGHRTVQAEDPGFSKWDLRPTGGRISSRDDEDEE